MGAPLTLRIGAHPLIARLRQHVVPPQPPQLFLKGGFLALCFPSQLCRKCAFHSKTEGHNRGSPRRPPGCGPAPSSRPPPSSQAPSIQPNPSIQPGPDFLGVPPTDPPGQTKATPMVVVWGRSLLPSGKRSIAGLGHYRPRIPALPSLTVLTGRSAASVGASSAHANGQRRSRQFRVGKH